MYICRKNQNRFKKLNLNLKKMEEEMKGKRKK